MAAGSRSAHSILFGKNVASLGSEQFGKFHCIYLLDLEHFYLIKQYAYFFLRNYLR